jgi:hypothetical protein
MSKPAQNPLRRFIGKVQSKAGQYGNYLKILIDNPSPVKFDKAANATVQDPYNIGMLLWLDNATGKRYLIKQIRVLGVTQEAADNGFVHSIAIDLDNEYETQELS